MPIADAGSKCTVVLSICNLPSAICNCPDAIIPTALSEIQRSDARAAGHGDASSAADRDAKIEQLLLAGLDHYFAAQYEQAINVWTRALFLDRNHARARAYIERARGALAERQRQFEELLHKGVAAYDRGETDEARRLLQAAIDGGAPPDEALALLERLNRPGRADASGEQAAAPLRAQPRERGGESDPRRSSTGVRLLAAVTILAAALPIGMYVADANGLRWRELVPFFSLSEPATPNVA